MSAVRVWRGRQKLVVERARAVERDRQSAAALRDSEQRLRATLDTAVDAILTIDERGRIESVNSAAEPLFGYRVEELVGRNVSMLMPEPDRSHHDGYLNRYRQTGERHIIGVGREVLAQHRDGSMVPVELAVSEVQLSGRRTFTGIMRDIRERKELHARLAGQALHDQLTGLGNRSLLLDRLNHALTRLARHPGLLAVLYLDLDNFKVVNDSLGHVAGDQLLTEVAARLRQAVRPADTLARIGGDEFVVLCEDLPSEVAARRIAERVVNTLTPSFRLDGTELFAPASVGVVMATSPREGLDLLRDADLALYQAKTHGRSRYEMFDEGMRAQTRDRLALGTALHHALGRNELGLLYQPLIDLDTGQVRAVEALLRWQHPDRGLLTPASFLALAEETRLIVDIDAWVLRTACRQATVWAGQLGRPLDVWVNIAPRTLVDPRLPDLIVDALRGAGLPAQQLSLEITEGALMQDIASTARTLHTLKRLGLGLAVDDFGTGYSSLAYLRRFPVNALKVDRSFLADLDTDESNTDSQALVGAIGALADALGLDSVAEGLETPAQLRSVTHLKYRLGQGNLLGHPTEPDHILAAARGTGFSGRAVGGVSSRSVPPGR